MNTKPRFSISMDTTLPDLCTESINNLTAERERARAQRQERDLEADFMRVCVMCTAKADDD